MWKTFSYDSKTHEFIIARNVVGDFGLHLSLIRSVSWGNNIPVESPFYPGVPMSYHYGVDVIAGLLERAGIRIDIALNGISAVAFTALLYLIYLLPQKLFGKNKYIGIVSVLLFLFHGGWSFMDYLKNGWNIWRIPNYIHAGPFDGSLISTFFTLNVYANQRHTVVALALGLWVIYELIHRKKRTIIRAIIFGCILGLVGWVHTLLFAAFCFIVFMLRGIPILVPALILFIPRALSIVQATHGIGNIFFNPGFLSTRPFTWISFINFWWLNLGVALILIPLGFIKSGKKQKLFFISFFLLFIIANTFQLSYRIDHNHTLINLFMIIANMYIANLLWHWWHKRKIVVIFLFATLTLSGLMDLMVIKNDYHLRVADAPKNPLMQWIKVHTDPNAIIIAPPQLLDPVTLSGRKNYVGHDYYLSVMGYDYKDRLQIVKRIYEKHDADAINLAKKQGAQYIIYNDSGESFRVDTL